VPGEEARGARLEPISDRRPACSPVDVDPIAENARGWQMYENMVDVLIYLYENYMDGERRPPSDQDALEDELSRAGFSNREIDKALRWLDELAVGASSAPHHPYAERSMRVYAPAEMTKLDVEGRGLLLFLEQSAILDPESRELVIDRLLAIDDGPVSVEEIKWVVLLVLMNRPGREDAFTQMEEMVYSEDPLLLH
jgi:Smg protein